MTDPSYEAQPFETQEAVEILGNLSPEQFDPRITEFGVFIASRLNEKIAPSGFVMVAVLSLYDLEKGLDGFSKEPINNNLVGLSPYEYIELSSTIAPLARIAFPEEFADDVAKIVVSTGLVPSKASEQTTLDGGEVILEPINDIETAYQKIIVNAKKKVLELEWGSLEVAVTEAELDSIECLVALCLRNAPSTMPISLLVDDKQHESELLSELLPHQKKQLHNIYWLVMLSEKPIQPDEATMARDHVFLKAIELISVIKKIDPERTLNLLSKNANGPINRASLRLATILTDKYPEALY